MSTKASSASPTPSLSRTTSLRTRAPAMRNASACSGSQSPSTRARTEFCKRGNRDFNDGKNWSVGKGMSSSSSSKTAGRSVAENPACNHFRSQAVTEKTSLIDNALNVSIRLDSGTWARLTGEGLSTLAASIAPCPTRPRVSCHFSRCCSCCSCCSMLLAGYECLWMPVNACECMWIGHHQETSALVKLVAGAVAQLQTCLISPKTGMWIMWLKCSVRIAARTDWISDRILSMFFRSAWSLEWHSPIWSFTVGSFLLTSFTFFHHSEVRTRPAAALLWLLNALDLKGNMQKRCKNGISIEYLLFFPCLCLENLPQQWAVDDSCLEI